jgi:hypothetical protein
MTVRSRLYYQMEPAPRKTGVHLSLPGTPHNIGAKAAVGQVRNGLHQLVAVLANDCASNHPIDDDKFALDVIELTSQLSLAELHALRICCSILVRIGEKQLSP